MGMWITFNVGSSRRRRDGRAEVLRTFFDPGGMVVDSSPMQGSAEDVIGYCLDKIGKRVFLFGTTKVWTPLIADGEDQMSESRALWGVEKFDLMQVHNLVNWAVHLETLSDDTAAGRVRHIGITTSHGSRHSQMARVMANPARGCGSTYLQHHRPVGGTTPAAAGGGTGPCSRDQPAVSARRPVSAVRPAPTPGMGRRDRVHELGAVLPQIRDLASRRNLCAPPATSQVSHMKENMGALYGALPDTAMRARIVRYTEGL
jgi:diketogulonate reductase-like aldo/keto reductase